MSVASYSLTFPAAPAGQRPTRLPITPAGRVLTGKDGRAWNMPDPAAVLGKLAGRVLVLDENHSSYLRAPKGEPAPALARLSNFSLAENGSIWAEAIEWTAYGAEIYDKGEYLGLSPVLLFAPGVGPSYTGVLGDVVDIHSVAMVNDPNLPMPAINSREFYKMEPETLKVELLAAEPTIDLSAQIAQAVAAAFAPIAAAIAKLTAVPEPIAAPNAAQLHQQACDAAFQRFVTSAKLTPTPEARALFAACSATPEGLVAACAYYESAPSIVVTTAANLSVPATGSVAPATDDETKICKLFGRTPADLNK